MHSIIKKKPQKRKPISLNPLEVEDAIKLLLDVKPKKGHNSKSKKISKLGKRP